MRSCRPRALPFVVVVLVLPWAGACAEAAGPDPSGDESSRAASPESRTGSADPGGMRVQPDKVSPGATVDLHFPAGTTRGVPYALEHKTETGWAPEYLLLSHPPRAQGSWVPWDEREGWEEQAYSGPGPDPVVIPLPASPGSYRICSLPGRDYCGTLRVQSATR